MKWANVTPKERCVFTTPLGLRWFLRLQRWKPHRRLEHLRAALYSASPRTSSSRKVRLREVRRYTAPDEPSPMPGIRSTIEVIVLCTKSTVQSKLSTRSASTSGELEGFSGTQTIPALQAPRTVIHARGSFRGDHSDLGLVGQIRPAVHEQCGRTVRPPRRRSRILALTYAVRCPPIRQPRSNIDDTHESVLSRMVTAATASSCPRNPPPFSVRPIRAPATCRAPARPRNCSSFRRSDRVRSRRGGVLSIRARLMD